MALKHISAMSDSFGNCCAEANQKSAGWVALISPTLDRCVHSSVFAYNVILKPSSNAQDSAYNGPPKNQTRPKFAKITAIRGMIQKFAAVRKFMKVAIAMKNLQP